MEIDEKKHNSQLTYKNLDLIKDFCVCHAGCFIDIPFLQGAEVVRFKYDFGLTGFGGKYQLSQMHFFSVNWNVVIRDKKRVF